MLNNWLPLLAALFYTLACVSLGCFLLSLISKKHPLHDSALVLLATALILGAFALASFLMLIALVGWFKLSLIVVALVLSVGSGVLFLKPLLVGSLAQSKAIWVETRADSWGWQWVAGLGTILLVFGAFSMVPWSGDGIAFYMALSKIMASANRLILLPAYEGFMSVGLLGEMHMAVFLKFTVPIAHKFFSGIMSAATLIMLLGIASKAGLKARGKWLVVAAYTTSSAVFSMLGTGKADLLAASLGLAAYYYAFTGGPLSLIGLFCGFAATAKSSYVVTVFPGIAFLMLWKHIERVDLRRASFAVLFQSVHALARKGMIVASWCLLASLPHILKNGVLLNAPFAPIGLSGAGWFNQISFGPGTTRRIILTYPVAITLGNYWAQGGNLSPLLLALAPFSMFLPRPSKWLESPLLAISFAGLIGMGVWLLCFPSVLAPRYILATLLLFLPVALRGAEYLSYKGNDTQWPRFLVQLCTMITLITVGINSVRLYQPALITSQLTGLARPCDLDYPGGLCKFEAAVNAMAQPGERVFLATYYRYWLRPDLLQCTNGSHDAIDHSSRSAMWEDIYERGFRYLIVDGSQPAFDTTINPPPIWVKVTPLYVNAQQAAFRLDFDKPASLAKPMVSCKPQDDQGLWAPVSDARP